MGGKTVDCIRIRAPSRQTAVAPSPPPPADEMSDEIPF